MTNFPQIGNEVHIVNHVHYFENGALLGLYRVECGRVSYVFAGPRGVCRVQLRKYRGRGHRGVPFVSGRDIFADPDAAFAEAEARNLRGMNRTPDAWLREPGVEVAKA